MPKISIIIPSYNAADCIKKSIKSVLDQTYQDFELIVIDDGSTDDTSNILDCFSNKITLVRQKNKGPGAARNLGMSLSQGRYVSFLDADDLYFPDHLEKMIKVMEEFQNINYIFSDAEKIDVKGNFEESVIKRWKSIFFNIPHKKVDDRIRIFNCKLTPYLIKYGSFIATPTMMIRKKVFLDGFSFREGFYYGEDNDLWGRIAYDFQGAYVDEVLTRICARPDSLIHDSNNIIRNQKHLLLLSNIQKEYYKKDKEICKILDAKILLILNHLCWQLNNVGLQKEALQIISKYFKNYPLSLSLYKNFLKAYVLDFVR